MSSNVSPYYLFPFLISKSTYFIQIYCLPNVSSKLSYYMEYIMSYPHSQICLFLVTLRVLSTAQVFCRLSLSWNLCDVFLMIRLGYGFWGGRPLRSSALLSTSYQRSMPSTWFTAVDGNPDGLDDSLLVRFLYCETIPFFTIPYYTHWKELTV